MKRSKELQMQLDLAERAKRRSVEKTRINVQRVRGETEK